jgi:hypothetical protein
MDTKYFKCLDCTASILKGSLCPYVVECSTAEGIHSISSMPGEPFNPSEIFKKE